MTVALDHTLIGDPHLPMLVMSSSLGTTRSLWDPQRELQSQRSLLLYDHRGHGASPSPAGPYTVADLGADVIALLDTLGAGAVSFCGLSLGGMVGLWLAAHHPERIDRLVVMSALARLEPAARYTERAATVRAGGIAPIATDVVRRWFSEGYAQHHPATLHRFGAELQALPAEGYAACCEALAACDLRTDIRRIEAPTLLVAGAEDPIVRPGAAVLFGNSFREASVAVVSGAGHLVNVERPDVVNGLIADHLAQREES